jgi:parallel beta-helix repeat protein
LIISNNTVENCCNVAAVALAGAISLTAGLYSKVINNTVVGSNSNGIAVVYDGEGVGNGSDNVIVEGNTIQEVNYRGIVVSNSDGVKICNNLINNPDVNLTGNYGGIDIISSNYAMVTGNTIFGSGYKYGIRINGTSPVSSSCQIYDNYVGGTYSYSVENSSLETTNSIREIISEPKVLSYTSGSTTINVSQNVRVIGPVSNGSATSITNFTNGYAGQIITLYFTDANTTITRANCKLAGGTNFTSTANSSITLLFLGSQWVEIARTTSVE